MHWYPASVARMLKEPCYWGEAVAYRYEAQKREKRDPVTNRVRRIKTTRYRDLSSELIVHYSADVWPGLVPKELAQKALARLKQNQVEAERNLKHVGESFLRAGLVTCGYCGANMVLHHHAPRQGAAERLVFVCGKRRAYSGRRSEHDCPAGGQYSIRVKMLESDVWGQVARVLADPARVPAAYEALAHQEANVAEQHQRRVLNLTQRIDKAKLRRSHLAEAVANAADADVRQVLAAKMATESTAIRKWEAERERAEAEAQASLAQSAEVRHTMDDLFERLVDLFALSVAEKRKLAKALGLRVVVYRHEHQPWFEMVGDLPGLEASWHAVTVREAMTQLLPPASVARRLKRAKPNELRQLMAMQDRPARLSERILRDALDKWTAPVVATPTTASKAPAAAGIKR